MELCENEGVAYCDGILEVLLDQRSRGFTNSIYQACQCDMAYSSNRIEGSRLSHDATKLLWEEDRIVEPATREDVQMAANHFEAFDYMLDRVADPVDETFLKELHGILLAGTRKGSEPLYNAGGYKVVDNYIEVSRVEKVEVTSAADIERVMGALLSAYNEKTHHTIDEILEFHVRFESAHPFSDGNGRIGRLVMFKEALENDIMPFIITDDIKQLYIRGLREWENEKGYLRDTCLHAQDRFASRYFPLAKSYCEASERMARALERRCETPALDEDRMRSGESKAAVKTGARREMTRNNER